MGNIRQEENGGNGLAGALGGRRNPALILPNGMSISRRGMSRRNSSLMFLFGTSSYPLFLVHVADGIGDEETTTRQHGPGLDRFLPSAGPVTGHGGPAAAGQEELPPKTRPRREGDHRLVRSDPTRSQA